ncbi:UNVERIFIED_CONTAM: hypothetical protein Sindi_2033000 [Sesamum indicum]
MAQRRAKEPFSNTMNKQKAVEALSDDKALQVVIGLSQAPTSRGSAPAPLAPAPPPPRVVVPVVDPHGVALQEYPLGRIITSTVGSHSSDSLSGYSGPLPVFPRRLMWTGLKKKRRMRRYTCTSNDRKTGNSLDGPSGGPPSMACTSGVPLKKSLECPVADHRGPRRGAIGCPLHGSCNGG